ncbi:MAG: DUF1573 domain-containing protein [Planctomycetota bacterium]
MKNYWLILFLSLLLGTSFAWAMNYVQYGRRTAYFGELSMDGAVNADNVMQVLATYHSTSMAKVQIKGEPTFDFGAMPPGGEGEHEFFITNVGDEALELEVGATTCKCTLGSLGETKLPPGETTSVKLEWTVAAEKNTFSQSAELRTNDPSRPAIKFTVKGLVIREIEFEPKTVTFGEVASGEPFEFRTKMYNYLDNQIDITQGKFGSTSLSELAEFEFEPFEPSEADGVHQRALQGFDILVKVKPGLRQGPMVTSMVVAFNKLDGQGSPIEEASDSNLEEGLFSTATECAGRIIGSLSMLENSKLRRLDGGGYVWTVGKLDDVEALPEVKGFVALKGSEMENTTLSIGKVSPDDVIKVKLGKPLKRATSHLYPISLTFETRDEMVDLMGKNKDDFGSIWIESDNPKVSSMRIAVKVALPPNP